MLSKATIERATGVLLVLLVPALFMTLGTLHIGLDTYDETPRQTMQEILDKQRLFEASVGARLAAGMLSVLTGIGLYLVFRHHERNLAQVGAVGFLLAGASLVLATYGSGALGRLAEDFGEANGADASMIAMSARPISYLTVSAVFGGLGAFFALGLVAFGALIVWRAAVPRWMGYLAIVCGVMISTFWIVPLVGVLWFVGFIGMLGAFVWQLALGVWMLVWGTRVVSTAAGSPLEPALQPAS